ncbi:MAG: zinc ribbon domain-containing protein [Myxococcales bacterium]
MTAGWLALVGALLCGHASAEAPAYAGKYRAGPTTVIAEVSAWGEDCGVRPQSQTLNEQPIVEVKEVGNQLELKFPDHILRSNGCWSQNPAVKLTASSVANGQWKADCATAQGDSKRELGHYIISAISATTLELREESEYLWQLKTSHCTAKVRTLQRLERTHGDEANTPPPAPVATPEPACVPGPLARIKLRPQEARIQPGERVCFSARGFDAQGCASELETRDLEWTLEKAPGLRGTLNAGCFRASESTAEAEGTFQITALREGKRDQVTVSVSIADLSDITARRDQGGPNGLSNEDSASGGLAGAGVKAVEVRSGPGLEWLLAGAAAVLVLGSLAGWLWSRQRAAASAPAPRAASPVGPPASAKGPSTPAQAQAAERVTPPAATPAAPIPATVGGEPMICPQCRRGYPPGSERCQGDGTRLVPYATFVRDSKVNEGRSCSGCGAALDADALFCGNCGRRV